MPGNTKLDSQPGGAFTRYLVLAAFLALFLLPVLYYGFGSEIARWNAARAQLHYDGGNVDEAIETMNLALKQSPDDRRLKLIMSQMLMTNGRAEKAMGLIDEVLELDPESTAALNLKANALIYAGLPENALAVTKQCFKLISSSRVHEPDRLNELAYYRALAGRESGRAMSDINRAIGLLKDDRWWADGESMPLAEQNLVAAAILSMQTNQQSQVLKHLDDRIDYLEIRLHQLEFRCLRGVYKELKNAVPFLNLGVEQTRRAVNRIRDEKLFLAILLSVRGLLHQDLGNDQLQQLDRSAVLLLGHDADQLLSLLPNDWNLLGFLVNGARILDTRGLVRYSVRKELQNALYDFDIAILSVDIVAASFDGPIQNTIYNEAGNAFSENRISQFQAVLLKHRSEVYRLLGRSEDAETDLRRIKQLGFKIDEPLF